MNLGKFISWARSKSPKPRETPHRLPHSRVTPRKGVLRTPDSQRSDEATRTLETYRHEHFVYIFFLHSMIQCVSAPLDGCGEQRHNNINQPLPSFQITRTRCRQRDLRWQGQLLYRRKQAPWHRYPELWSECSHQAQYWLGRSYAYRSWW
jgi:hypothetical protein